MKKISIILVIVIVTVAWGCSDINRSPGRIYMPDMAYSRAYETYASTANLDSLGINYTKQPVPGTIKRGEFFPFPYGADKAGDTTNYILSKQVANPLQGAMTPAMMVEAERLYLVNCGICHGTKLDGNGPLYNGGAGPYAAAPRNLVTDPIVTGMPDGQMFFSITYGKGQMGPYGPQLSTSQRWMIVSYVRSKQAEAGGVGVTSVPQSAKSDSATVAVGDTTVKKDTTGN